MYVIRIPLTSGKPSYFKRAGVGKLPRVLGRHDATIYEKKESASRRKKYLADKFKDRTFIVEPY